MFLHALPMYLYSIYVLGTPPEEAQPHSPTCISSTKHLYIQYFNVYLDFVTVIMHDRGKIIQFSAKRLFLMHYASQMAFILKSVAALDKAGSIEDGECILRSPASTTSIDLATLLSRLLNLLTSPMAPPPYGSRQLPEIAGDDPGGCHRGHRAGFVASIFILRCLTTRESLP